MLQERKIKKLLKRRLRLGRWSVSVGVVTAVTALLIGGGAVYARLGGAFSDTGSTVNLQKGLIGWWKLDGNSKDATPYGNDATLVNSPVYGADRKAATTSALAFNGTTQQITINGASVSTATTIAGWFNNTTTNTLFRDHTCGGGWLLWNNAGTFSFRTAGTQYDTTISVSTYSGVWTHYAITKDASGNVRLYINGSSVYSGTGAASTASLLPWHLMENGSCNSAYTQGSVDDFRIYNRALSVDEAKALYEQYDAQVKAASGEKGLVGWWKLDGNAKDATPYSQDATVTGASLAADHKGAANSAYAFSATGQNLTANMAPTTTYPALTIEAWVKPTAYPASLATVVVGVVPNGYYLSYGSDGSIQSYWYGKTPSGYFSSGAGTVPLNQWSHVAVTYDSSTVRLYVNGALTTSTATSGGGVAPSKVVIGEENINRQFIGSIDDIRIYNRTLSLQEISAQANSYNSQINLNSSPSSSASGGNINAGLVGYWLFNGNTKDATPYQHDGTLIGSPSYVADRKGRSGAALGITLSTQWVDNIGVDIGNDWSASVWSPYPNNGLEETGHYRTLFRGNTGDHQVIIQTGTYSLGAYANSGTPGFKACTPSFNVNSLTSAWHNLTVTQAGGTTGTMIFYIDGIERCRINGYGSTTDIRSIGNYWGGGQEWGTVDDVRIYDRTLTPAEVTSIYNGY